MSKKYQMSLGSNKIIKDQSLIQFEEIKKQITIIPALEALIPPLLADERKQLEENILRDGCRESLLIWNTPKSAISGNDNDTEVLYVLIDGHNRYNICTKNGIDFKINLVNYDSYADVREFMINNQLGRRNLSSEQVSYLRGLKYLAEKKERGKYDRTEHKGQNVPYENTTTSDKLGEQYKVSEKTIKRDAEFALGMEKLSPKMRAEVLGGTTKISKELIQKVGKLEVGEGSIESPEQIESVLKKTVEGDKNPSSLLKTKLIELAKKIDVKNGDIAQLDEIIALAKKMQNLLKG